MLVRRFSLLAGAFAALVFPARGALDIVFDFSYDSTGFFSGANLARRQVLEAAAGAFETRLTLENFGAIQPSGSNQWSLSFSNPSTGSVVTLQNFSVPANQIRIYVGGRDLAGSQIGYADYGYGFSGNASWVSLFQGRDSASNFDSFGGAIAFDTGTSFYFDTAPATLESFPGQYDFYSVALHEIGHLLGFTSGTNAFAADTSGGNFIGANVMSLAGGAVPLDSAGFDHWAQTVTYGGQTANLVPTLFSNERRYFTELDFAALKDIGYNVQLVPEPTATGLLVAGLAALGFAPARQRGRLGGVASPRKAARQPLCRSSPS